MLLLCKSEKEEVNILHVTFYEATDMQYAFCHYGDGSYWIGPVLGPVHLQRSKCGFGYHQHGVYMELEKKLVKCAGEC
jgi:hypothetical protein